MNLLEPIRSIRRESIIRKASHLFSLLVLALSIALLAQGMLHLLAVRKTILAKISEKESTYQMLRPEIRPLIKKQAHFEERLKHLERIISSRMRLLDEIDIISRSLPDDVWLVKVDLSKNAYIDGLLEGYTLSFEGLTHLIDELKQGSGSDAVKPLTTSVTTDEVSKRELISFSIQIKKEIPLPDSDKRDSDVFKDERQAQ